MLPKHFMVSETDGGLYDTRQPGWHKSPAIRPRYALINRNCRDDTQAIRAAIRQGYAWPGGYALFGITTDGAAICIDCMKKEYRQISYSARHRVNDGWRIAAIECAANCDGPVNCDQCSKSIVDGSEED